MSEEHFNSKMMSQTKS